MDVQTLPDVDEHLAREFIQGLVQSAIARGIDPAARLQQFRTLQQAVVMMTTDPAAAQASKRLVRAIDLMQQELTAVNS